MNPPDNSRRLGVKIAALIVLIIATAALLEIALHIAARSFPRVDAVLFPGATTPIVADDELLQKGNPRFLEHDANGFRNSEVPRQADIVAIGDSQVYGTNVTTEQAWPHVLGRFSTCRVYSMSVAGYGPLQYAPLAVRALHLDPRLIFVGIYFGNDLFDNWEMYLAHGDEYPLPTALADVALARERAAPLAQNVGEFFSMGEVAAKTRQMSTIRAFFSRKSSLWGFARAVRHQTFAVEHTVLDDDFDSAVAALTPRQLEYASVFEGAGWRTIFTSRYREVVQNDLDPRIQAGHWLTIQAVRAIDAAASAQGTRAVFVLLPTKESVFFPRVQQVDAHAYLEQLVTEEKGHRDSLIQYLQENGIRYVDMLPPLSASGEQPYFENADGHLNPIGHRIVAARLSADTPACSPRPSKP